MEARVFGVTGPGLAGPLSLANPHVSASMLADLMGLAHFVEFARSNSVHFCTTFYNPVTDEQICAAPLGLALGADSET